jgi:deoxyribodipyrimidine photo-lyase
MAFTPTRAAALSQLSAFLPNATRYAGRRNFDLGPGNHSGVSRLSPYIRTRLVTEEECSREVLGQHSPCAAEKFLQEIAWRTYWKGWLEMRPSVWSHYLSSLAEQEKPDAYESAISGETGIECFDHWARELVETGYLHNHARMWFASIWIFTLKLPWQLGADFFLNNLLDGDPAANTLSWRWVAGLPNIEKFTNGRFNPAGQLNESASPIPPDRSFERQTLHLPPNPKPQGRVGHLMFPEDLSPPPKDIGKIHSTAAYLPDSLKTTSLATGFLDGAITDTLNRTQGIRLDGPFQSAVNDWISAERLDSIVISKPTVGHTRDFLVSQPIPGSTHEFVRNWDRLLWPHATAGFFKLKKALPKIHASLAPERKDDLFPHI